MRKTKNIMKGLTAKEEEIMGFFWEKGPLFVKEMLAFYEEPKPHFNTLSTIVRGLEDKGFLSHHTYGNTYQYYAVVSEEDFRKRTLKNVISKYFNNSYLSAVSSLVKEEDISLEELKQLIQDVEKEGTEIVEALITLAYEKHRIGLFAAGKYLLRIAGKENRKGTLFHGMQYA